MLSWATANVIEVAAAERDAYQREVHADGAVIVRDAIGDNIRAILERLRVAASSWTATAEERSSSAILRAAAQHLNRWIGVVRVGTRLDIGAFVHETDVTELLSMRQEEFARLIRNITADVRDRIARETIKAITEGSTNAEIAEALQEIDGISQRRAELIARDQATKLNSSLNEFRQRQAGVSRYRWKTILDGRERPTHHDNNDHIFDWDRPPTATGHPGTQINCRCRALAIIDDDEGDDSGDDDNSN